jgi:hypothetical protein
MQVILFLVAMPSCGLQRGSNEPEATVYQGTVPIGQRQSFESVGRVLLTAATTRHPRGVIRSESCPQGHTGQHCSPDWPHAVAAKFGDYDNKTRRFGPARRERRTKPQQYGLFSRFVGFVGKRPPSRRGIAQKVFALKICVLRTTCHLCARVPP